MDKNNGLNERAERIPQRTVNLFEQVRQKIILIRDCQVILDVDVAELYGVETKRVNEAVRNNPDKFPQGYVFQLSDEEMTANLSPKTRVLPKAFTEKGLYMLATILKSPQATQATLAIIETFASVRQLKRELHALHGETDGKSQQSKMQHMKWNDHLSCFMQPLDILIQLPVEGVARQGGGIA